MSGPGWMPSRPRPLGQVRRRLVSYASPHLRRVARRVRRAAAPTGVVGAPRCDAMQGDDEARAARPFASQRAKLPVATLLPHRSEGQPRVMTGALQRWLGHRWLWIQPRLIPLIVAFVGLIGVLNARRYLLELARGPAVVTAAPANVDTAVDPGSCPRHVTR